MRWIGNSYKALSRYLTLWIYDPCQKQKWSAWPPSLDTLLMQWISTSIKTELPNAGRFAHGLHFRECHGHKEDHARFENPQILASRFAKVIADYITWESLIDLDTSTSSEEEGSTYSEGIRKSVFPYNCNFRTVNLPDYEIAWLRINWKGTTT